MSKERDERGFMEKAGRINRDVGLVAIVVGALVNSAIAVYGIINVVQGKLTEDYFKNRRLKKEKNVPLDKNS